MDRPRLPARLALLTALPVIVFGLANCGKPDSSQGQYDMLRAQATAAAMSQPDIVNTNTVLPKSPYEILVNLSTSYGQRVFTSEIGNEQYSKPVQVVFNNPEFNISIDPAFLGILDALFQQSVELPDDSEIHMFMNAPTTIIMWDINGKDGFGGVNPVNPQLGAIEVTAAYKTDEGRMSVVTSPYDSSDLNSPQTILALAVGWAQAQTNGVIYMTGPHSLPERMRTKEMESNTFGGAISAAYRGLSYSDYTRLMGGASFAPPPDEILGDIQGYKPGIVSEGIYKNMTELLSGQDPFFLGK